MEPMSREEARRQARLARRMEDARRRQQRQRARALAVASVAAVVALAAGWAVWRGLRPEAMVSGLGDRPRIVTYPDQGRTHVAPGEPHPPYNSSPPTSGWHYATTASWGFHPEELPDELLVHNLEHGGIWISYKDATDTEVIDALSALVRGYRSKVVVTHRPANDSRIAVAAWRHLMTLDRYDRDAIVDFINRFRNRGPEFVPD